MNWRHVAVAVLVVVVATVSLGESRALAQQTPQFDVSASLRPRAATLGEQVKLVVTVRHGQDLLISSGEPARVTDIELLSFQPEELTFDDSRDGVPGMATTTFEFTIAAYQLGDLRPGDIEVSWLGAEGATGSAVVRPPILRILPVRTEGDEELRPLKPQANAGDAPGWWQGPELPVALLVLMVAAASFLLWRRLRPSTVSDEPLFEAQSPEDQARKRLDSLRGVTLADHEAYRHFYGEVSMVVRAYLAERFGFNATAFTTMELRPRFDDVGVGRWQARLVVGLLERCDAAVYARARPDPASADHDLTVAYEIVEISRPRRRDVPEAVSA